MKVLYDYQIFDVQLVGGIPRYNAVLYHGCIENGANPVLGARYSSNIYLRQLGLNLRNSFAGEENILPGKIFKYKGI